MGIMLNTASSTLRLARPVRRSPANRRTETFGSPSTSCGDTGIEGQHDAAEDREQQVARRTRRRHQHVVATRMTQIAQVFTGTGFAQPMSGTPPMSASNGKMTVPIGSACTIGFSETLPSSPAV